MNETGLKIRVFELEQEVKRLKKFIEDPNSALISKSDLIFQIEKLQAEAKIKDAILENRKLEIDMLTREVNRLAR